MESCYQAKKVSLHVRKSNRGAIRLYEQVLGYEVDSVAKSYYSDGEDAYLMQVELPLKDGVRTASSSLQVGADGSVCFRAAFVVYYVSFFMNSLVMIKFLELSAC